MGNVTENGDPMRLSDLIAMQSAIQEQINSVRDDLTDQTKTLRDELIMQVKRLEAGFEVYKSEQKEKFSQFEQTIKKRTRVIIAAIGALLVVLQIIPAEEIRKIIEAIYRLL